MIVLGTAGLMAVGAWAETSGKTALTLTLEAAIERAVSSNFILRAAERELEALRAVTAVAGAANNPEVGFSLEGAERGTTETADAVKEIGVSQTFSLGKLALKRSLARFDYEAAKERLEALRAEIRRGVKEHYWDAALAEDRVIFAKENHRFQQRFLARIQDRFQSGQVNAADVARARLETERARNDVLLAERDVKTARARLNRLMGEPIGRIVELSEHPEEIQLTLDAVGLAREAATLRSELREIHSRTQGARIARRLAGADLWRPDLTTNFIWQRGARDDSRPSWGAGAALQVPLFNQYGGRRREARANEQAVEWRRRDVEASIEQDVLEAFWNWELAGQQVRLWRDALDQGTEAMRLAEQQYMDGEDDLLVFIAARREFVAATLEYLASLRNHHVSLALLEQAVARDLTP
ncbi:MAG: TolC family protein [Elusimicrobia bacterium]|nr:TolC family protein [Elusimicrobiota bacterium]